MLSFGPASGKRVALAMAEFAWSESDDPDGVLIVRHCKQEILCQLCDYKSPRGLLKQIAKLEALGWLDRDDMPTGPKMHREYYLEIPEWVPPEAIRELTTPSAGMWKRVLQPLAAITGELQDTRYQAEEAASAKYQVNSRTEKPGTGELESNNRCPAEPEQVNSSSPLKESLRSSLVVSKSKEGHRFAGDPPGKATSKKTEGLAHISNVMPDHTPANEEVLQGEVSPSPAVISAEMRNRILPLARLGKFSNQEIAKLANMPESIVAALLTEVAA
jgi:hypothetical protein